MRRPIYFALLTAVLIGAPRTADAGKNAGGSAHLTWDPEGRIEILSRSPANPFLLYLHLQSAPDIRSLAVDLRWYPTDELGCYALVSAPLDSLCGAANPVRPGGDFEGDSTYAWSISFSPLSSGRECVVYLFSGTGCTSSTPAEFRLASVLVKDSNGAVDTLATTGFALITPTLESSTPTVETLLPAIVRSCNEIT